MADFLLDEFDTGLFLSNPTSTVDPATGITTITVNCREAVGTLHVAWYAGSQTAKTPADIIAGTGAIDFTSADADFSNQFTVPFQSWDADYFAAFTQEIPSDMLLAIRTTGASETFTLPAFNTGTYDANIDWGDGTPVDNITAFNDAGLTHTYDVAGDYTIRVSGTFPALLFNNAGPDLAKVIHIYNLGAGPYSIVAGAFHGLSALESLTIGNGDITTETSLFNSFRDLQSMLAGPDFRGVDFSNTTSMSQMMSYWTSCITPPDLSSFNTSLVTNMSQMMRNWTSCITPPDLSSFDTSLVTDMSQMMYNWPSMLYPPDLSSFNTSLVTNMSQMMRSWSSMTTPPDLSGFNTSLVTDMSSMMRSWSSMTTPPDLSGFNTSLVTNMADMMSYWSAMTVPPDLSNFNTSLVTNMVQMMYNWAAMTAPPDLSGFNTSLVTDMSSMMYNWSSCLTPPDLSSFNTSLVTDMSSMMRSWSSMGDIDIPIDNWNVGNVADFSNVLTGTTLTTACYDRVLIAWAQQDLSGVTGDIHFGNSKYTPGGAAETAHTAIENMIAGAIIDGGPVV